VALTWLQERQSPVFVVATAKQLVHKVLQFRLAGQTIFHFRFHQVTAIP
jgi:hypothetical protein